MTLEKILILTGHEEAKPDFDIAGVANMVCVTNNMQLTPGTQVELILGCPGEMNKARARAIVATLEGSRVSAEASDRMVVAEIHGGSGSVEYVVCLVLRGTRAGYAHEMPTYTYLLQVQPKGGGNWANLLEPRTGTPIDGTFGTVDVPESGLPDAATKKMARFSDIGLKRRVTFWEGRRVNERLYSNEFFCVIYDDGTITGVDGVARDSGDASSQDSAHVRPGCPHAPHDVSCGHEGPCMFAHHGRDCKATRPVCPSCFDEVFPSRVPDIVGQVRREGELVLRCSSCEQLSFQFDTDLICDLCQWLVPDVNEELEERFAANGGEFSPRPGSCPGCSHQMPQLAGPFTLGCPKCGQSVILSLESFRPGTTTTTMCPNRECSLYIKIPPSIWCPVCGQNLRPLNIVTKLTLEANDTRPSVRSNVREDESTRLARRLAEAAEASLRNFRYLSQEQQGLLLNERYLDSLISSVDQADAWIRGTVEIRAAGHQLNREGGMRAMQEVHQQVMELGLNYRNAAREIERCWDGVGDWLG
ncbi:hypothetical protein [Streptomyces sp. NPDC056244]|uniref:hypothetical protein n=1 Tax=Streptomyces sp. NPDC056244 TaxID=3345762 RepID=UPI0035DF13CD